MAVTPIRECPGRSPTDTEQNWYHMSLAPGLGICSRCYHDFLTRTPLAADFDHEHDTSGAHRFCDFNVPRTHAVLRDAAQRNDFAVFRDYWVRRSQIARCKGAGAIVVADDKLSWFRLADPNMADKFVACHACYEDFVAPSFFAAHFAGTPTEQPPNSSFVCDMAWPFCHKLVGGTGDWGQISSWLLFRTNLPPCTGVNGTDSASRRWHKLRTPEFDSLLTCEACYYDIVHNTNAAEHFQSNPYSLLQGSSILCMVGGNISLQIVLREAIQKNDCSIFKHAALVVVRSPPCQREGMQSPVWYSLVPAADEVDICRACYACCFESLGAGHILQPKYVPPGQVRLCSMNLAAPNVALLYSKLDRAIDSGNHDIFTKFARVASDLPQCPGMKPTPGLQWYATDSFICCKSCWHTAPIEGTQLAGCFSTETYASAPVKCDFYSARVRNLWRMACLRNDLAGFTTFMKKREAIYQQTYPEIQRNLQVMQMNMARQSTLAMAAVINTGANNIAAAAAPVGAYGHWGNSALGYGYETAAGVQGAMQYSQAQSMLGANASPQSIITHLNELWKTVE